MEVNFGFFFFFLKKCIGCIGIEMMKRCLLGGHVFIRKSLLFSNQ